LTRIQEWHPIVKKEISFFANQEEWQKAWDEAKTADELTGLLFRGLKIPLNNEEVYKQVSFYLEVAYGRQSNRYSCSGFSQWTSFGNRTISQLSQDVCLSAWKFLCQDFFKDQDKETREDPSWFYRLSVDHRIIDKILWFFLEKDNCSFSSSHDDRIVVDFLVRLAEYTWSSPQEDIRQHLFTKRQQMMKILWNIGKLDFLLQRWEYLTQQDMDNLKELALTKPWGNEYKHKTVEEAAIGLSGMHVQAARMYIILNTMLKEKVRQDEMVMSTHIWRFFLPVLGWEYVYKYA